MIIHSFALLYLVRNIGGTKDCREEGNGVDYNHIKPQGYFGYSNLIRLEAEKCI